MLTVLYILISSGQFFINRRHIFETLLDMMAHNIASFIQSEQPPKDFRTAWCSRLGARNNVDGVGSNPTESVHFDSIIFLPFDILKQKGRRFFHARQQLCFPRPSPTQTVTSEETEFVQGFGGRTKD